MKNIPIWNKKKYYLRFRNSVGMILSNSIVKLKMAAFSCLNGGGVLYGVAQLWIKSVLIGHVLNRSDLVFGINVREGTSNDSRAVRHFGVLTVNVARSTSCLITEHIRACRPRSRCCGSGSGRIIADLTTPGMRCLTIKEMRNIS